MSALLETEWVLDRGSGLFLISLLSVVSIAYAIRVFIKGRARFDRVDVAGGSIFVDHRLMEMGYWALQPVGQALARIPITPNQISFTSVIFGAVAGWAFARGSFGLAAGFTMAAGICDALDGLVSRLKKMGSPAGKVIDSTVDRYVEFLCLGGMALYWRETPTYLGIVLMAIFGSFMISYSTAKAEAMSVTAPRGMMRRSDRVVLLIAGALVSALIPETTAAEMAASGVAWKELVAQPGFPLLVCTAVIAVGSNFSAVARTRAVALTVEREATGGKK